MRLGAVKPGGKAFIDSSLIKKQAGRADIAAFYIPAATLAEEAGMKGLGNIVMLGAVAKETGFAPLETHGRGGTGGGPGLEGLPHRREHPGAPSGLRVQQMKLETLLTPLAEGEALSRLRGAAEALGDWYPLNARRLPWREREPEESYPYRVWVSEIMLQQTRVEARPPLL